MRNIVLMFVTMLFLFGQTDEKQDGIFINSKIVAQLVLDVAELKQKNLELQKKADLLQAEIELLKKQKIQTLKKVDSANEARNWIIPVVNIRISEKEKLAQFYKNLPESIPNISLMTDKIDQHDEICDLVNVDVETKDNVVLYSAKGNIEQLLKNLQESDDIVFGPVILYPQETNVSKELYNIVSLSLSKPFAEIDHINYPYQFIVNGLVIDESQISFSIGSSGKYYYKILLPKEIEKFDVKLGPFWQEVSSSVKSYRVSIYRLRRISMPDYIEHLGKIQEEQGEDNLWKALVQIKTFYMKRRLQECSKEELRNLQKFISTNTFENTKIYELANDIEKMIQAIK